MRHLSTIVALLVAAPCAVTAQGSRAEREVRAFLASYDHAVATRDIAFLERVLPDDYVMTGTSGRKSTRAQMLKFFTQERDKPSYRMVSLKHEAVVVHVVGAMAVVTNAYTSQTTPVDAPNAEPDIYTGRHTGVFEKRNGRWMVIAEQDTEQPHDDKLMERQVVKAGRDYLALTQRLLSGRSAMSPESRDDVATLTRMLRTEYTGTSEDGVVTNKAGAIERITSSPIRLISVEMLDQTVLAIDNNAAVERTTVRMVGTNGGQQFETTQRHTKTWVSWGNGWQVVASHASVVKE